MIDRVGLLALSDNERERVMGRSLRTISLTLVAMVVAVVSLLVVYAPPRVQPTTAYPTWEWLIPGPYR
jgi:hypothetical protein